jgi:hypothetical protein
MAEERVEEKVEDPPPTRAVLVTFDQKAGEVANPKQNPLMDLFNNPSNNTNPHTASQGADSYYSKNKFSQWTRHMPWAKYLQRWVPL